MVSLAAVRTADLGSCLDHPITNQLGNWKLEIRMEETGVGRHCNGKTSSDGRASFPWEIVPTSTARGFTIMGPTFQFTRKKIIHE